MANCCRSVPPGSRSGQADADAVVALGAERPLPAAVARVRVERGDAPVVGLARLHGEQVEVVDVVELAADVDERRDRRPVAVPAGPVAAVPATSRSGSAPAPGTSGATTSATTTAAPPSNAAGASQCGRARRAATPASCGAGRAPRGSARAGTRPAATQNADGEQRPACRRCRASTSTRRTRARARRRAERGVAPEREPVGDRRPSPTPRAPRAGWRRRWPVPGAGAVRSEVPAAR